MEEFIVSARKYRPGNFHSLMGQDNIATTLQNSIKKGQLAHAYLFCGPRGVGKTTTARIFAKAINCYDPDENMEPCGKCESCLSFDQGRSYNIHELDAASNNSVDDIRTLTEKVRIAPQIGKYSVYIIDEVHMLSQSAFNAFLKTLEEPPAHAVFILATTEKHKILPTILSRCQTYDFNRISIKDIIANLTEISAKEGVEIDADAMHIIAEKADGAMRDALTLFDQTVAFSGNKVTYQQVIRNLNVLDYDYFFRITDYFLNNDYAGALTLFDEILSKGFNALYFISGLSSHFRDLLVCKSDSTLYLLDVSENIGKKYREQATKCQLSFLFNSLNITTECESSYKLSGNPRLLIELALLRLSNPDTTNATKENPPKVSSTKGATQKEGPTKESQQTETSHKDSSPKDPSSTSESSKKSSQTPPPTPAISIKNLMKEVEKQQDASSQSNDAEGSLTELTQQMINDVWAKLLEYFKVHNKPRLCIALSNADPTLAENGKGMTFYVDDATKKKWIEEKSMPEIRKFLTETLHNSKFVISVEVKEKSDDEKEEDSEKKLYMPEQRVKFLLENYPELRGLKEDLDLDTP